MTNPFRSGSLRPFSRHLLAAALCAVAVQVGAATPDEQADNFIIAARNDNLGTMNRLLDSGLNPNVRNSKGQTGLTVAMQEGSTRAAKLLLARPGTDIDALNTAGESPLMMAAIRGDIPGATLLLDRGAHVNLPGWAPLHYAASGPEPKLVQLLLDRGAVIDAPSPNGTTPLMMAAQYGPEDSVKLLLDRGADPKRRNQRDQQALDFARRSGRDPVIQRVETASR